MNQLTVKELYEACKEQIAKGNGDKMIVVGDDNELNGAHGLFHNFTEDIGYIIDDIYDSESKSPNKIILLG